MRTLLPLNSVLSLAAAHGIVTSPPARVVGQAYKAACGQQLFNNQQSDPYGNIQQLAQMAQGQKDFNAAQCNLALCKGYAAADNTANVQQFAAGQEVQMTVDIRAPHTGVANVSLVDTGSNSVIGQPLIAFDNYASTKTGVAANNTKFSVTMPSDLGGKCAAAGACVVQWWWDSREADQTYMSCVDFTMP